MDLKNQYFIAIIITIIMITIEFVIIYNAPEWYKDCLISCSKLPYGSFCDCYAMDYYYMSFLFIIFGIPAIFLFIYELYSVYKNK